MTVSELRDIYTDFLIVQTDKASATACSDLLDNTISHDRFSRLLSRSDFNSQFLWEQNKSFVRKHQNTSGVLSLDNSILHKPHSSANEIINYHYDHGVGKVVKGINLLTALIEYDDVTIPIGYEVLTKDLFCIKKNKNGQEKFARKSRYSINELARKLVKQVKLNGIQFSHLTGDRTSVKLRALSRHFINPLKYRKIIYLHLYYFLCYETVLKYKIGRIIGKYYYRHQVL